MRRSNFKAQRGFTLVEVIVVAVIVAILAGVSIPLYLGYINESRNNAAVNAAGSAASFAAACVNGSKNINLDENGLTGLANGTVRVTCTDPNSTPANAITASLVIPTGIRLRLNQANGNAIIGNHTGGGADSQPFTFR